MSDTYRPGNTLTVWLASEALNIVEQNLLTRHVETFRFGRTPAALEACAHNAENRQVFLHRWVRGEFDRLMGPALYGFMGFGRYGTPVMRRRDALSYLKSLCKVTNENYGKHLRSEYN